MLVLQLEFTPDIKASCAEVINIITAEDCSEDGLESATALLINIVVSLIESRNHVSDEILLVCTWRHHVIYTKTSKNKLEVNCASATFIIL